MGNVFCNKSSFNSAGSAAGVEDKVEYGDLLNFVKLLEGRSSPGEQSFVVDTMRIVIGNSITLFDENTKLNISSLGASPRNYRITNTGGDFINILVRKPDGSALPRPLTDPPPPLIMVITGSIFANTDIKLSINIDFATPNTPNNSYTYNGDENMDIIINCCLQPPSNMDKLRSVILPIYGDLPPVSGSVRYSNNNICIEVCPQFSKQGQNYDGEYKLVGVLERDGERQYGSGLSDFLNYLNDLCK